MDNIADLLQIKIEKAKAELPEDTQNAINAVDWKIVILSLREKKGYTFEQLGDLETETELLLCGLVSPENYSKELEKRMRLSKAEVNDLVREMNDRVFAKIKENLIKIVERKEKFKGQSENPASFARTVLAKGNETEEEKRDTQILSSAGIEIIPPTILTQKMSSYVKNEVKKTEHSLNNLTPSNVPSAVPTKPVVDPYREIPE